MPQTYQSKPEVTIGGRELTPTESASLMRTVVETDLLAPSVCRLEFSDRDGKLLEEIGAQIGDELEVHTSPVSETLTAAVFVGSIFAVEYQADERGGRSAIVGYDAGFTLRQTRATTSFNDVTDGDVVRSVCSDVGVDCGTVEAGDVVHPYLAQLNETNWDFLERRAAANDCIMFVADGKLQFRALPEASDGPAPGDRRSQDPLQLAYPRNLVELSIRQSAAGQAGEIVVQGWDPFAKAPVSATSEPRSRVADGNLQASTVGADFGAERILVGWPALATEAECTAVAASAAEATGAALTYAEGRANGDPRLMAGVAISLGVTGRFDGRYTLSTARHVFDAKGYFTDFTVSGEHDRSMYGLLSSSSANQRLDGHWPALVTNIQDPNALGRVKVKFPWLADDFESNWSRVVQMGAGSERGLFWFPEVDDEVLVSFLDGDAAHPVVLGGLYNGVDVAPLSGFDDLGNGTVDVRCMKTRSGHTLEFNDAGDAGYIKLVTADESCEIVLDQDGGKVTVTTSGDLEMRANGNALLESGGSMEIKAGGTLKVEAATIDLN